MRIAADVFRNIYIILAMIMQRNVLKRYIIISVYLIVIYKKIKCSYSMGNDKFY